MRHDEMRPTWVEIDLDRIAANVSALKRLAPHAALMAVVKADGYGHGAIPTARVALEAGATWLGVATVEEADLLRRAGLDAPLLVLGYVVPLQAPILLQYEIRTTVFHLDLAEALSRAAVAVGRRARVHMKVDTGMGRVGVRPEELVGFAQAVRQMPNLEIEGVFTHLATADEPENPFAQEQLAVFTASLEALRLVGIEPPIRHACNSAGLMLLPEGHYDLVRGGIALYGLPPDPGVKWPVLLQPALSWRTRVSMVKRVDPGTALSYGATYRAAANESIATLPVGYADGFSRRLSNRGFVLIHGHRCPVVGRVCMDQTMVRVPEGTAVQEGDEVVLIGEQDGSKITAGDMAQLIDTINYEVVCAVSKRVPRFYRRHGQLQSETSC
jgi:alanine racemase